MNTAVFFVLLAFVYLVHGRSYEGASSNDNLVESGSSSSKSARIVNQPSTGLIDTEENSLIPLKNTIKSIAFQFLPVAVAIFAKTKLATVQLLFGAMFGIVATVATCYYTPLCRISLGSQTWPADRIMELMSPENLSTLTEIIETYEKVRQLN